MMPLAKLQHAIGAEKVILYTYILCICKIYIIYSYMCIHPICYNYTRVVIHGGRTQ